MIFLRHAPAADLIDELEPAGRERLHANLDVPVLAVAAGLPHETPFGFRRSADRLAVGHLRLADVGADAELALHAVDDDFQVQLAHAGQNRLAGIGIGGDAQRGIFLHQLADGDAELLLVGLCLGLDGELDDRGRKVDGLENYRRSVVADRVAGRDRLQSDRGADIAREDFLNLFTLVGVHLYQAADALVAALGDVVDRIARVQVARIDTDEDELPHVGVGHDLEDQRRERRLVVGPALDDHFRIVHRSALHRRNIHGRRQIIHHRVEQVLHALVLERRAADDREDLLREWWPGGCPASVRLR